MKRRQYTVEEKAAAVVRHGAGESAARIAIDIGTSRHTVNTWIRRARIAGGPEGLSDVGRPRSPRYEANQFYKLRKARAKSA